MPLVGVSMCSPHPPHRSKSKSKPGKKGLLPPFWMQSRYWFHVRREDLPPCFWRPFWLHPKLNMGTPKSGVPFYIDISVKYMQGIPLLQFLSMAPQSEVPIVGCHCHFKFEVWVLASSTPASQRAALTYSITTVWYCPFTINCSRIMSRGF